MIYTGLTLRDRCVKADMRMVQHPQGHTRYQCRVYTRWIHLCADCSLSPERNPPK